MENIQLTLLAHSPVCSFERLATACQVTENTVRGWAEKKYIPTIKIGRHNMVNLVKFKQELSKQA